MEDNVNSANDAAAEEKPMERKHYTKQQNIMYTVISVILFFVLYFGGAGIIAAFNRPYNIYLTAEAVRPETLPQLYEISGLSAERGLTFETARLAKGDGIATVMLFSGLDSDEEPPESFIGFEYGDPIEDVRIEFYPYSDSPAVPEYAFGTQYVDIDHPERTVSVFEFEGGCYAMYSEYGNVLSSELKSAFKDGEKASAYD